MNILFVVGVFPTYSETFIINQINDLIDRGHHVYLLSMVKGSATISDSYSNKYQLVEHCMYQFCTDHLSVRISNKLKRLLHLEPQLAIKEVVALEKKIDIVHCHFGDHAVLFHKIYLTKYFKRAAIVCTFHGYDFEPYRADYYKKYYRHIITRFDGFLYNTLYFGRIIKEVIPTSKCYELPVGFDKDFLDPFYQKRRNVLYNNKTIFTIVFCGRLIGLKGVLLLPEIAKVLIQNNLTNFNIAIIGDGDLREELIEVIRKNDLDKYFKLYGSLKQEKVFDVMSQGDIFILPGIDDLETGRAETQGLVIQEAQFLGLPVITSNSGGTKFGMIDGETGFVVKQNDVNGFAEKIISLMLNNSLYNQFSVAAHQFAAQYYTSDVLGQRLMDIYKKLM